MSDSATTYDVIVVGAGAAGLAAAAVAASRGRRVLIVESTQLVGGTTAISGGMVWIPGNHMMDGADTDLARAVDYMASTIPAGGNQKLRDTFMRRGDEALRYFEAHTALHLRPVANYPDYYPAVPGSTSGGRVLEPLPFDGAVLGQNFKRLRPPLPEFTLFGGMMISRGDIPHLRRVLRSPGAAWHVAKLFIRYRMQRLRWPRGTTLYLGNALAARLFQSVLDQQVEVRTGTRVARLIAVDGRVTGIEIASGDGPQTLVALSGVILASGGISHATEMRSRYMPAHAATLSATSHPAAAAGGAALAEAVNAAMSTSSEGPAFWVPASIFTREDGSQGVFPHTVTDRGKPGLIAIDSRGRRFVNEALSYHEFVRAQLRVGADAVPAWLICDRRFLWKYGLGRVKPFALSTRSMEAIGYLRRGASIEALAREIGVDGEALRATVDRYNVDARRGIDTEFGRGSDIYQRYLGDAECKPNPCVAPIEAAPYYGVAVYPADLGMAVGILTDERARVLDGDGAPIAGLYACGNDMHSIMNGAYPGPGITLGPALVFAYCAAMDATADETVTDDVDGGYKRSA